MQTEKNKNKSARLNYDCRKKIKLFNKYQNEQSDIGKLLKYTHDINRTFIILSNLLDLHLLRDSTSLDRQIAHSLYCLTS